MPVNVGWVCCVLTIPSDQIRNQIFDKWGYVALKKNRYGIATSFK